MASVTAQCMQQTTAFATVRAGKTAMWTPAKLIGTLAVKAIDLAIDFWYVCQGMREHATERQHYEQCPSLRSLVMDEESES